MLLALNIDLVICSSLKGNQAVKRHWGKPGLWGVYSNSLTFGVNIYIHIRTSVSALLYKLFYATNLLCSENEIYRKKQPKTNFLEAVFFVS